MKLKIKILTTIMSMTLALGVMGFAVFAATSHSFTITNSISFGANNVIAVVTAAVTGTGFTGPFATESVTLDGSESDSVKFAGMTTALNAVNLDATATINDTLIMTITVTNSSSVAAPVGFDAIFTDSGEVTSRGLSREITATGTSVTPTLLKTTVESGQTVIYTITITLNDTTVKSILNNSFSVTLTANN